MTTLAIELSASRLLGNVFGTSNLVWATIIGLILIYLAVGYFIGGRIADRWPDFATFYRLMLWGAFTAGAVPLVAKPVLRWAADAFDALQMGVLFGSFAAVLVLFIVPITLLGTISPFAIRLSLRDKQHAGDDAGRIYAISTLGSFIGTFLPVLVLTPLVGTTYTFVIFSGLLMAVALAGMGLSSGWGRAARALWMPALLAVFVLLWANQNVKNSAGQVYETESAYNYIQVLQEGETMMLRLNEGQGVHSMYNPDELAFHGPWMQFLAGPFFNAPPYEIADVERIAIIGLAAGTTARQATAVFGPAPIDGWEIDPKIIQVGRDYFGMTMPNLNAIAQDGRWGMRNSEHTYDLVAIDAYRPPYIPWHLTTVEFFEEIEAHLSADGVVVINVGRAPNDRSLIDALATTMGEVFPSVHVMDIPFTFNSMVYATRQSTTWDDLALNYNDLLGQGDVHPVLLDAIARAYNYQQPAPARTIVFTDEHAPVEWIINRMVLNFLVTGDYEELQ